MTIVWILSYLAVFMFGGIAMYAGFYFSIKSMDESEDRKLVPNPYNYEADEEPAASSLREWN